VNRNIAENVGFPGMTTVAAAQGHITKNKTEDSTVKQNCFAVTLLSNPVLSTCMFGWIYYSILLKVKTKLQHQLFPVFYGTLRISTGCLHHH
jgi:hypothetical protein